MEWPYSVLGAGGQRVYPLNAMSASGDTVCTPGDKTMGSWQEVIASTTEDLVGLYVGTTANSTNYATLLDVGVGSAGNELVIAPTLLSGPNRSPAWYHVPVPIPAGSRVAVRSEGYNVNAPASSGVAAHRFYVLGIAGDPMLGEIPSGGFITAYGARGASAGRGTVVARNTYVELAASTTYDIHAIAVGVSTQNNNANGGDHPTTYNLQVGVGGSGSEYASADMAWTADIDDGCGWSAPQSVLWVPCQIPAGTRLTVYRTAMADATDQLADCVIYGLTL